MVNEASKLAERNLAAGVCYRPAPIAELGISARAFSDRLCGCVVLLATIARDVFGDRKPVSGAVPYDVATASPDGSPLNEFDVSEVALLLESGCFTADSAANDWSIVRRNWTRRCVIDKIARIDGNDSVAALERVQELLIELEAERGGTPIPLETLVRDYALLKEERTTSTIGGGGQREGVRCQRVASRESSMGMCRAIMPRQRPLHGDVMDTLEPLEFPNAKRSKRVGCGLCGAPTVESRPSYPSPDPKPGVEEEQPPEDRRQATAAFHGNLIGSIRRGICL